MTPGVNLYPWFLISSLCDAIVRLETATGTTYQIRSILLYNRMNGRLDLMLGFFKPNRQSGTCAGCFLIGTTLRARKLSHSVVGRTATGTTYQIRSILLYNRMNGMLDFMLGFFKPNRQSVTCAGCFLIGTTLRARKLSHSVVGRMLLHLPQPLFQRSTVDSSVLIIWCSTTWIVLLGALEEWWEKRLMSFWWLVRLQIVCSY